MNWTVQNVSPDTITVTDTPIPVSWVPGQVQTVPAAYFLRSAQLSQAVQGMQLCITAYGAFTPLPGFAPLTYVVQGTWGTTGLAAAIVTQSGIGTPLTLGPYQQGNVLINVQALSNGGSIALAFQAWDSITYYPTQAVGGTLTATGAVVVPWNPPALAGRFTWTVSGSVTWTVLYQVSP